ncbi:hypothetical protein R69619_00376 [Paraburkholderia nemoris]|uniref:hypothetical protein n=1 Tax=Paraburkholderia nemoris TaxID=2793076 RepID=UPI00190C8C55|nr:hypothetical protein [Paraburkholderia nemoris]MBK3737643.1 hypothetical protein [Paraburkholderia aspalathi]CAE6693774.1 hypothetical protein R69619_00376 [Paraburkholderia nemoris]
MSENFALRRFVIPRAAIGHLSTSDVYSLHLLGHIFNETMALTRLIHAAQVKREDATDTEKAASVFHATFFARLLAGKIYEAQQRLNSAELKRFLSEHCFPHIPAGAGQSLLKSFNSAASNCNWLNSARNGHAMHYPSLEQWEPALTVLADNNAGFEFVCGLRDGETLYHSSDAMAGLAFFFEVDRNNWLAGAKAMIDELSEIGDRLGEFIQTALRTFVIRAQESSTPLSETVTIEQLPTFDRPNFERFEIPYFFTFSESETPER